MPVACGAVVVVGVRSVVVGVLSVVVGAGAAAGPVGPVVPAGPVGPVAAAGGTGAAVVIAAGVDEAGTLPSSVSFTNANASIAPATR
ncbi:MAG: hypothetical protein QOJ89_4989, partial [bacterium]